MFVSNIKICHHIAKKFLHYLNWDGPITITHCKKKKEKSWTCEAPPTN